MRVVLVCMLMVSLSACSKGASSQSPTEPSAEAAPVSVEPGATAPADTTPSSDAPVQAAPPRTKVRIDGSTASGVPSTPADLYAQCKNRLERPEAAGECSQDSDCAPAGCSAEKCITKTSAADLMSTCEVMPCFAVVDECSCSEGTCSWSIKDEMPANSGLKPIPVPL